MVHCIRIMLLLLLLSACRTAPVMIESSPVTAGGTIGVVSLLQEQIVFKNSGMQHRSTELSFPIPSWKINDYLTGSITRELAAGGTLSARHANDGRDELAEAFRASDAFPVFNYSASSVKAALLKSGAKNNVDFMLLVVPWVDHDIIYSSGETIQGYGIYRRDSPSGIRTRLYSIGKLVLLDARTARPVAESLIFFSEGIDNDFWRKNYDMLTEMQQQYIEKRIKDQTRTKVFEQMRRMGLLKQ